jgi:hypothetical protein
VSPRGSGQGSVTGSGIDCPPTCSHTYPDGTEVVLTATAKQGSTFAGWSGADCEGAGNPCPVTIMGSDGQVGAIFNPLLPVLSALGVSPGKFTLAGRLVRGRCVAATAGNRTNRACTRAIALRLSYKLTIAARVTFTFKQELAGRLVNGRCVPVSRANQKQRGCTLLVPLSGSFGPTSGRGTNSFVFNGQLDGRKLTPGSYRLSATPTANGRTGSARSISFQIVP